MARVPIDRNEGADRQEEVGQFRVREEPEQLAERAGLVGDDPGVRGPQRLRLPLVQPDPLAVHLREKLLPGGRHQVHHVPVGRLAGGQRGPVPDHLLRELGVAPAALGDRHRPRRGVVDDLLVEVLAALPADRRRRADVGPRRHRGDVGGEGDEGTRGRGPPPFRCHVHDDRHLRVEQRLDDVPGGREGPARGVQLHEQRGVVAGLGRLHRSGELLRHHRRDLAVDGDHQDRRLPRGRPRRPGDGLQRGEARSEHAISQARTRRRPPCDTTTNSGT